MIEGQVLNAQYAEESYLLKRENCTLKKQIEDLSTSNINNHNENETQTQNKRSSDFIVEPNNKELEILQETVNRLSAVSIFIPLYYYIIRSFFF